MHLHHYSDVITAIFNPERFIQVTIKEAMMKTIKPVMNLSSKSGNRVLAGKKS